MKQNQSNVKRAADYLGRKVSRLSNFQIKLLLIIFLSTTGLYCAFLTLGGAKDPLSVARINIPLMNYGGSQQQLKTDILSLKDQLDSIGHTPEGKLLLDSLAQARPGLLDSIREWNNKLQ